MDPDTVVKILRRGLSADTALVDTAWRPVSWFCSPQLLCPSCVKDNENNELWDSSDCYKCTKLKKSWHKTVVWHELVKEHVELKSWADKRTKPCWDRSMFVAEGNFGHNYFLGNVFSLFVCILSVDLLDSNLIVWLLALQNFPGCCQTLQRNIPAQLRGDLQLPDVLQNPKHPKHQNGLDGRKQSGIVSCRHWQAMSPLAQPSLCDCKNTILQSDICNEGIEKTKSCFCWLPELIWKSLQMMIGNLSQSWLELRSAGGRVNWKRP